MSGLPLQLFIINKSGGVVFNFTLTPESPNAPKLSVNDFMILVSYIYVFDLFMFLPIWEVKIFVIYLLLLLSLHSIYFIFYKSSLFTSPGLDLSRPARHHAADCTCKIGRYRKDWDGALQVAMLSVPHR